MFEFQCGDDKNIRLYVLIYRHFNILCWRVVWRKHTRLGAGRQAVGWQNASRIPIAQEVQLDAGVVVPKLPATGPEPDSHVVVIRKCGRFRFGRQLSWKLWEIELDSAQFPRKAAFRARKYLCLQREAAPSGSGCSPKGSSTVGNRQTGRLCTNQSGLKRGPIGNPPRLKAVGGSRQRTATLSRSRPRQGRSSHALVASPTSKKNAFRRAFKHFGNVIDFQLPFVSIGQHVAKRVQIPPMFWKYCGSSPTGPCGRRWPKSSHRVAIRAADSEFRKQNFTWRASRAVVAIVPLIGKNQCLLRPERRL